MSNQLVLRNRLFYTVTLCSELLLLSICTYGILQVHSNEVSPMKVCFHGQSFEEVCHKANRRCVEGRDLPNTTTTTAPTTTSTTSTTTTAPTTSTSVDPPVDGTTVTINFKFKCYNTSNPDCNGSFEVESLFIIGTGNVHYNYMCDDILRVNPGTNAYAKGLRISTLIWRMLLTQSSLDTSPPEVTQKWLSCPKIRNDIQRVVDYEPYPIPPQPLHYTCWCFKNDDPVCDLFLNKFGHVHGLCFSKDSAQCYLLLCSDEFGKFINRLNNVDEVLP